MEAKQPAWRVSLAGDDPDRITRRWPSGSPFSTIDPSRPAPQFDVRFELAGWETIFVGTIESRSGFFMDNPEGAEDWMVLDVIDHGGFEPRTAEPGRGTGAGVYMYPERPGLSFRVLPETRATSLFIPRTRLAQIVGETDLSSGDGRPKPAILPRSRDEKLLLQGLMMAIQGAVSQAADGGASPLFVPLLEEAVLRAVAGLGANAGDVRRQGEVSRGQVGRASDYIEAHLGDALTVEMIARAAGCSVRSLQAGFRKRLGVTPLDYLQALRLERAHRDMGSPEDRSSVTVIAHRWGFHHLGRFSAIYRNAFGVLPSETRRQAMRLG